MQEAQQGPPIIYPEKQTTLENLASLNRFDTVGRALETLIANGELADYDDELANRVKDAIEVVRGVSKLCGVPLSWTEHERMEMAKL